MILVVPISHKIHAIYQGSQTRWPHVARNGIFCAHYAFWGIFRYVTVKLFTLFIGV